MKLCLSICATALAIGGLLLGQTPTEKTQTTKKTTNTATTKTTTHSATGTVKEYTQGKSIVVTSANNKDVTFDLVGQNVTANVAPEVAVGNKVRVVEKTDNNGNKTVTVTHYPGPSPTPKKSK
jgi:hypothetical protein